jgi:hypothetical protein
VRETKRASETAGEEVEDLISREISHYLVQNVYKMPAGFSFIPNALKLGFGIAQSRPQ